MESRSENPKNLYCVICRTKIDCGCLLYNAISARRLKKLYSKQREGIRIYTKAFRTQSIEVLYLGANDLPLELRRNEMRLRFL